MLWSGLCISQMFICMTLLDQKRLALLVRYSCWTEVAIKNSSGMIELMQQLVET